MDIIYNKLLVLFKKRQKSGEKIGNKIRYITKSWRDIDI